MHPQKKFGLAAVLGLALVSLVLALPSHAVAAGPPPDPDSACASEATFKSTAGTTKASLTIVNNTDETVQSFWLDYHGARVFYRQVPPHSRYVQPTWLTHPWVIASLGGTCYRLVVMTALQQTVTVDPGAGGVIAPVVTFPPPLETFPTAATAAPGGLTSTPGTSPGSSTGMPVLPVVGGLAALLALIGGLFATGRLPGFGGSGATGSSGSGATGSSGSGEATGIATDAPAEGSRFPGPRGAALGSLAKGAPAMGKSLGKVVAGLPDPKPVSEDVDEPPLATGDQLRDLFERMNAENAHASVGIDPDSDGFSVGAIADLIHFDPEDSIRSRPLDGLAESLAQVPAVGAQVGAAIGSQSTTASGAPSAPTGMPSSPASQFQLQEALGSLQGQFQDLIAAATAGNAALEGAIGTLGGPGSDPMAIQQAMGSIQEQLASLAAAAASGNDAIQGALESLSGPGVTQLQLQQAMSSIQEQFNSLTEAMSGGSAAVQGSLDSLSGEAQTQLQQTMGSIQDQYSSVTDAMSAVNSAVVEGLANP